MPNDPGQCPRCRACRTSDRPGSPALHGRSAAPSGSQRHTLRPASGSSAPDRSTDDPWTNNEVQVRCEARTDPEQSPSCAPDDLQGPRRQDETGRTVDLGHSSDGPSWIDLVSIRVNTTESRFEACLNRLLQQNLPQPDMRSGPSAAISSDRLSSGNIKTDYIDPVRTSANWKLSQTANLHRQGGPKLLHRRAGCEHHEAQGLRQRKPALASLHP